MLLSLIIVLVITLPVVWIMTEIKSNNRGLRIATGCAAIAMSFLVAVGVGIVEHFNANAWYGVASKQLIDGSIEAIEAGETERVLEGLRKLQKQFEPTYENRARYDKLVDEFTSQVGYPTIKSP